VRREDFLSRVRGALHRHEGQPAEAPPVPLAPLQAWETAELIEPFKAECEAVGGHVHVVADMQRARETVRCVLELLGATTFIPSTDAVVEEVLSAVSLPMAGNPADADVGLAAAAFGLANTGTLVLTSEAGRKASLLPMNLLALLRESQLVPTMAEALEKRLETGAGMPSAWVQVTGPSRTADIELTLTTGVHGPGVVHVVLIKGV